MQLCERQKATVRKDGQREREREVANFGSASLVYLRQASPKTLDVIALDVETHCGLVNFSAYFASRKHACARIFKQHLGKFVLFVYVQRNIYGVHTQVILYTNFNYI